MGDSIAPKGFICPVTHTMMHNPVFTSDGHTCERAAAEQW